MKLTSMSNVIDKMQEGIRGEIDCNIYLNDDDFTYQAYTAHLGDNEITFYCLGAHISVMVDWYGDRPVWSIYDIELDMP